MLFFDCFPMRSTSNSTDITLASSTPECRPKRLRKHLFLTWMAHTCVYTGHMNHTILIGVRICLYTRPKRVTTSTERILKKYEYHTTYQDESKQAVLC